MRAMATASSMPVPPSMSSSPQIRTPRARSAPIVDRTASTISSSRRARLANGPP